MPTTLSRAACRVASLLVIFTFVLAAATVQAQPSKSSAAAKELGQVLDRLKLDSIAAADPSEKDTFVAALYFQGSTLLVVSAKYAAPSLLAAKLTNKDYRDTYIDLNSASVAGTKIFVMDAGANGLVAKPEDSQAPDSWGHGSSRVSL